jgi:hypothetical protein
LAADGAPGAFHADHLISADNRIDPEDDDMTTTRTTSSAADVQDKAKVAYAKGSAVAGELGTFTKDNVDAVVASGKILGAGVKELSKDSVAEGKQAASTFVADLKAFAAVKSPTEFFNLQFKVAQRNIDAMLALTGKNGKALSKIASEAAAPLSERVKTNVAKLRQAA